MEREQAIAIIKNLLAHSKVGMMATNLGKIPHNSFPMGTQEMDEKGDLWFFSNRISDHLQDIQADSRVQIVYTNEERQEYLNIYGGAEPIWDEDKIQELWSPLLHGWFEDKKDSRPVLIKVRILDAWRWDSERSEMVSLLRTPSLENV